MFVGEAPVWCSGVLGYGKGNWVWHCCCFLLGVGVEMRQQRACSQQPTEIPFVTVYADIYIDVSRRILCLSALT